MRVTEEELIRLVKSIKEVGVPNTPKVMLGSFLPQTDIYCKLLLIVINSEETDPSLVRLEQDFHRHLKTIIDNELNEFPIAIEGLAQKFEAFLKKIGYFRYSNSIYWSGTSTSKGIKETTFKKLCDGILEKKNNANSGIQPLRLPDPLFNNTGIQHDLIDWIRDKLRNAVHQAPEILRHDIIPYSEIVLVCYLIVIKDNLDFLKRFFLPEVKYKQQLEDEFLKWKEKYIALEAEKIDTEIITDIFPLLIETDWQNNEEEIATKRKGNIINIFNETNQLVIIGQAGSGKSTTLQYLVYHLLQDEDKIPYYFPLKEFNPKERLLNQISADTGLEINFITKTLRNGNGVLLLDGLNELIKEEDKRSLIIEINKIKKQYKYCQLAITSRNSILQHHFEIPVFELQPLSDRQIEEFIRKNSLIDSELFHTMKLTQPRFKDLCRNPLILKMLCAIISEQNRKIPETKGQLIECFIDNILQREQFKNPYFQAEKINFFLIEIGFTTRNESKVSFTFDDVVAIISKASLEIDPLIDRSGILNMLIDTNFLIRNRHLLSFRHELYQEFFAAKKIIKKDDNKLINILLCKKEWEEPLLLYSGLTKQRISLLINFCHINPLLAAESILSSLIVDPEIEDNIIKILSEQALNIKDGQLAADSISALVKLNRIDLVQKTISINFQKFGKISFKHYPQIAYEIVKKINTPHFLDLIKLLLTLDQSFAPAIIRALEAKNIQEDLELLGIVKSNINLFNFQILKPAYGYKLLLLINLNNWKFDNFDVHNYCIQLLTESNSNFGHLLLAQLDWSNEELISKLFSQLSKSEIKNALKIFWFFYKRYPTKISLPNISLFINGNNRYLQLTALYYCIKTSNTNLIKDNLKLIEINKKRKISKQLASINALPTFIETIERLADKIKKEEYALEVSKKLGQPFKCQIANEKELYYVLRIKGCLIKAILPKKNLEKRSLLFKSKHIFYLSKLDSGSFLLEFSLNKPTLNQLLKYNYQIGQTILITIKSVEGNNCFIKTEKGFIVKIPITKKISSLLIAGEKIKAKVLDNDNGLELKLIFPKHSTFLPKKTLLGEKLKDAIKNKNFRS